MKMKWYSKLSLGKRLAAISAVAILPMVFMMSFLLVELSRATDAYAEINQNASRANEYVTDFKKRVDYTMYLAVVKNRCISELNVGTTTINGIVTVNPYVYINELKDVCDELAESATVESNRNQIKRIKNSLDSLYDCVRSLEKGITQKAGYDKNMKSLDNDVYTLTTLVQSGLQEYIFTEISNIDTIRKNLDRKNVHTLVLCLIATIAVIALSGVLAVGASRSVYVPIKKLCQLTNKVAHGDFTVKANVESGDEIAVLTNNFNDMTEEIGILIDDIKKNQKNLHIIETKLLQAQINPHFLYNTLDTIVWLAEAKKNEQVVAMVTYLSDFFRTTLSKGKDFITVRDEELHITSYLKIQKFRYQDILDYEIHIDEALYDYVIPKLLLQPLVENALSHGIRNKRSAGHICITGNKEGEDIIFRITDDGKGMSSEELERLRHCMRVGNNNARDNGGFGVVNVNQRIQFYYGEQYGLFFESEEGKGTEATIVIAAKNIQPFS